MDPDAVTFAFLDQVIKDKCWGGGVTADEMREMQWVKPELVAQIRFVEWTAEGRLRHAAFLGLHSHKSAREVRRDYQADDPDSIGLKETVT